VTEYRLDTKAISLYKPSSTRMVWLIVVLFYTIIHSCIAHLQRWYFPWRCVDVLYISLYVYTSWYWSFMCFIGTLVYMNVQNTTAQTYWPIEWKRFRSNLQFYRKKADVCSRGIRLRVFGEFIESAFVVVFVAVTYFISLNEAKRTHEHTVHDNTHSSSLFQLWSLWHTNKNKNKNRADFFPGRNRGSGTCTCLRRAHVAIVILENISFIFCTDM